MRLLPRLLLTVLAVGSLGAPPANAADQPRRPNVVFVLVDDMGYADAASLGSTDLRTPHIDRLAREGVRFTDAYASAPVCTPTRAAFVTGRYQQRVGLEWAMGFSAEQQRRVGDRWVPEPDKLALGLPATEPSLARTLKSAGYGTAIFGKWHLGFRSEYNPLRHGFDEFFGVLLGHADYYSYRYFDGTYHLYENAQPAQAEGYLTDLINQRAVAYIDRQGKKPFFLYVPYNAVHWPFQVPGRPEQVLTEENKYAGTRQDYAAMLEKVDQGVGRMLEALERQGVADETLFIFSSDNGGERLSNNAPLFSHKTTLWEGGIRVPVLMRWPARLPGGKVTHQPAITMDLTATILAAAGASPDPDRKLDGIDLLPIVTGSQPERERTFFWRVERSGRRQKAVRHGSWKYMQDDMVQMLFNLDEDVAERTDLAYRHPEVLAQLKTLLSDWEAEVARTPPPFVVR
jgi:arylsulfatase A-like enzyme